MRRPETDAVYPYFNLPALLVRNIIYLLRQGKQVEIIVGDKTANDFYIPEDQPFKIIGALPYLYEINLRRFLSRLQRYVDTGQLIVRLWKDGDNSYHLKGMWVDEEWQLVTGNNLNPRAWRLDLENAILIHDPKQEMREQQRAGMHPHPHHRGRPLSGATKHSAVPDQGAQADSPSAAHPHRSAD